MALCAVLTCCGFTGYPNGEEGGRLLLSAAQLNAPGYAIGVPQGAAAMTAVERNFPKCRIEYYNSLHDGYLAVKHGKLDAFAFDRHALRYVVVQNPDLALMDDKIDDEFISVGSALGNKELIGKVNDFIRRYRSDGTCQNMCARWLESKHPVMPEIPEAKNPTMTIKVGTDGLNEPMSFYANGALTGFDVEFARRLALFLNARLSLQAIEFPAIIAAASSGKIDLLIANLNAVPERRKLMLFSDTYIDSEIALLVRKDRLPAVSGKSISSFTELDGKKIASLTGTVFDVSIDKKIKNVTHVRFNDSASIVAALRGDKIAAWAADLPVAKLVAARFPDVAVMPELLSVDHYGFALRKGDPLARRVSEIIARFQKDGTSKAVEDKWLGADEAAKRLPQLDGLDGFDGSAGVLRFGHDNVTEPMSYVGDQGASLGLDVELASRVAHALNMRIELVPMNFGALIEALKAGKVDMVGGCMTITEERRKSVDFTIPYYSGGQALLVKKAPTRQEADVAMLSGKKVGVITGSVYDALLKRKIPEAIPEYFSNFADQAAALKAGKIAGFIADEPIARNLMGSISGLAMLKNVLTPEGYAFAISKNRPELRDQINDALREMEADGTLKKLDAKWFGANESAKILPDMELNEGAGVLRFATNSGIPPLSYVKNGKILGYDIEVATLIARKLGFRLEVVDMEFAAVIPALVSGKCDMAGCGITMTEERAKSVLFTDPDYYGGVVVVVAAEAAEACGVSEGASEEAFWPGLIESFKRTFLVESRYELVLRGLGVTLLITILSAIFGTALGFVVCAMRRAKTAWVSVPARIFILSLQGTPTVVLLMILYYIVFGSVDINGIVVAIVGFSLNFAAYAAEMMRSGVDAVDKGQREAALALGLTKPQVFALIIFPQAARHVLPVFKGEFISMLKMTSVVGYIAIQDLTKMSDIIRSRTYEAFFPLIATALIYFAIAYAAAYLLSHIERNIDPKQRKRVVRGVARP